MVLSDPKSILLDVESLQERNRRVETDKAWETSWTRRVSITLFTYIVAFAWLVLIKEHQAYLKALVPVVGYILSTLSFPFLKAQWIAKRLR